MKTSKPFSTISYNSPEFLKIKLDELVQRNVLAFYAFIKHYAEEDEKKDHIHLICFPNGTYQTDGLREYLKEQNPLDVLKPLGVMPFESSKFGDWYLYCLHDSGYLASKNQTRKHHYLEEDFVSSDSDYLHELSRTIDRSKYEKTLEFVEAVNQGTPFSDLVKRGYIPVPQFNQWRSMYEYLQGSTVFRNDRTTHSPKVDENTGELIEIPTPTNNSDFPFLT